MFLTFYFPKKHFLTALLFVLFAVLFLPQVQAQTQPLKIMPLGNSITQGGPVYTSYRYALWEKLVQAEVDFEFVGSQNMNWDNDTKKEVKSPKTGTRLNDQVFDNRHEGHWGWTSEQILNGNSGQRNQQELSQWLKKNQPDMVLLHLGTNDMFKGEILDEAALNRTLENLRETVRQIRAASPGVTILMAQLIPIYLNDSRENAPNTNINNLNARIPALAQELNTVQSPVVVVDQNTGYNPTIGVDNYDGVHPNFSGEEKMAQRWFEAIIEQIIVPLPVELLSFNGQASPNGVKLIWRTASEQDNSHFEIQRAQDAANFTAIGKVQGAGTTSLTTDYTFEDKEAPAGTSYYRLRQVDFNGEESYSNVVAVNLARGKEDMRLYPTRTQGAPVTLRMISLQPKEKFSIAIYTLEGKLVKTFEVEADSQGNYAQEINPSDLKDASMYMVRATLSDRVYLRHLLVD